MVHSFSIYCSRRYHYRVFLYSTKKAMYRDVRVLRASRRIQQLRDNYLGVCMSVPRGREFGTIHLAANGRGVEIVTHELTHAALYFLLGYPARPRARALAALGTKAGDERLARVVGRLSAQYWTHWHKLFGQP